MESIVWQLKASVSIFIHICTNELKVQSNYNALMHVHYALTLVQQAKDSVRTNNQKAL